jgi:hypothetical protein
MFERCPKNVSGDGAAASAELQGLPMRPLLRVVCKFGAQGTFLPLY